MLCCIRPSYLTSIFSSTNLLVDIKQFSWDVRYARLQTSRYCASRQEVQVSVLSKSWQVKQPRPVLSEKNHHKQLLLLHHSLNHNHTDYSLTHGLQPPGPESYGSNLHCLPSSCESRDTKVYKKYIVIMS